MRKTIVIAFVTLVAVSATFGIARAADDSEPKHSISEVMKMAHGKKLLNKVIGGDASQEEKVSLLDLYVSLTENDPPMGSADSWKSLTNGVVVAAAKVVVGRDGAAAQLKTAANCAACHKAHKPPQP